MPSHDYRPTAPPEVVSGYAYTAELAERRAERVAAWGDEEEAGAWRQVAAYCRVMAACRALDDDQFPDLAKLMRHRRERPLPEEMMDALAVRRVDTAGDDGQLVPYLDAIVELALGYLSPMQRVVFRLIEGERMSTREVAQAVGISPADVRTHLTRARRTLAEKVAPRLGHLLPRRRKTNYDAEVTR